MRGALFGLMSFTFAAFGLTNQSASASDTTMLGGVGSMHEAPMVTLQGCPATEAETLNAYFPVARGVARAGARVAWGAGRVAVGGARWAAGYPAFRPWGGWYRPWGGWYRPWGFVRPWGGFYRPWGGWYRPYWGSGWCATPSYYWGCADYNAGYCSSAFDTPANDIGIGYANLALPANQPEPVMMVQEVVKPEAKKLEYPAYGEATAPKRKVIVVNLTGKP